MPQNCVTDFWLVGWLLTNQQSKDSLFAVINYKKGLASSIQIQTFQQLVNYLVVSAVPLTLLSPLVPFQSLCSLFGNGGCIMIRKAIFFTNLHF